MIITSNVQIDLAVSGETPVAEAVQDDKYSRNLRITLLSNGVPWEVPAGARPVIRYLKPDGTGGSYDTMPDGSAACSVSGNEITAALAPQVCTAAGLVRLAVGLIGAEAEITTFTIRLVVHRNPGIDAVSGDYTNLSAYVKAFGWAPNMYLATDENGNVVAVEDVAAAVSPATDICLVQDGSTIHVSTLTADGNYSISQIRLNSAGYPVSILTDGTECTVSWQGFESTVLQVWEGGSY